MESIKIQAVGYLRVSTEFQVQQGYSLQVQRQRVQAQILAKGWDCRHIYEDGGQSGGTLQRPALHQLLSDIDKGEIQAVVIYKLDRLSRKQKDTMYLIEDVFLKNGVELVSISESIDTSSPTGRAMIGMLSVFAQLERDTITERLTIGRREKAKQGGYSGGKAPLGYQAQRHSKVLTLEEGEARTVKRVFALREEEGYTLQAIAHTLNAEGHRTKEGAFFQATQVMRILKRRALYSGMYSYGGETAQGQHSPILSPQETTPPYYSKQETARLFGVHPRTIDRWIQTGKLLAEKKGSVWRIPQEAVTKRKPKET